MSISLFATRRTEGGENRTPPKEAQLTNDTGNTNSAANKDIYHIGIRLQLHQLQIQDRIELSTRKTGQMNKSRSLR